MVRQAEVKPGYSVPTMAEINARPWNGFNAISTFSGCGGSSLGYRMAGFRILYANEFIQAARDTYAANMSVATILDDRDIRDVTADSILSKIGLEVGALDLYDGSPPCASFSTAGKRAEHWGKVKKYSDKAQRTDDLFFEYVRLLDGLQPKVFVAENVSGLVKGTAKGYFLEILRAMKASGYKVTCRVLDAQWLGVPQQRQRTIFIGIRNDIKVDAVYPAPLPYRYSVKDALPWIKGVSCLLAGKVPGVQNSNRRTGAYFVEAETDISKYAIGAEWENMKTPKSQSTKYFQLVRPDLNAPCGTITASGGSASTAAVTHPTEKRKFSIEELKRICAFPEDFIFTGTYAQQWERMGRAVPPVMMSHIAATIRDGILAKA